ncbi:MAG: GHMP kinase [Calditrichaeota bacterium]|nr:MAG: GHMP kinase [Calditrichota bacterium]MBL1205606.1 GHMP kinase [Calditrichota bacterium]NOG45434.1 GHMP kinase [Calditrichota bacterium]
MIEVAAPGRIGLFGEHQDYLGLPTITAAINLKVSIQGKLRNDNLFKIYLPDIKSSEQFSIPQKNQQLSYIKKRDYFRSVFNVLLRNGARFENGWDCTVQGNIPINSGTSSSSALCVAWTRFLIKANSIQKPEFIDPAFIGRLAYLAEVEEFGEPGGMMDHYASAVGGVLYQDFAKKTNLQKLPVKLGTFVLGDSLEAKDTLGILNRVKLGVLEAVNIIKKIDSDFELEDCSLSEIKNHKTILSKLQTELLHGAVINRDITKDALELLNSKHFDEKRFGLLMTEHQKILNEKLKISTPKINQMLKAAINAGAYGGKINGSGGGGCMFVYAPENAEEIAKAIEACGGKAYIITIS